MILGFKMPETDSNKAKLNQPLRYRTAVKLPSNREASNKYCGGMVIVGPVRDGFKGLRN